MAEEGFPWIVVVRGEAEGREVRVALEFQDAGRVLSPASYTVGQSFVDRLLSIIRSHDHWVVKTVIEEVRSPEGERLPLCTPLFALLSRSRPMGLSAGALFISSGPSGEPSTPSDGEAEYHESYSLEGLSPPGFAAACSDAPRLFPRFIARLVRRPESFASVSLLLPRALHPRRRKGRDRTQERTS